MTKLIVAFRNFAKAPKNTLTELHIFARYFVFRVGAWGSVVVKALRYWSDGPGIDPRWCHWGFFFSVVPSAATEKIPSDTTGD
jgi:hypothetical protein